MTRTTESLEEVREKLYEAFDYASAKWRSHANGVLATAETAKAIVAVERELREREQGCNIPEKN